MSMDAGMKPAGARVASRLHGRRPAAGAAGPHEGAGAASRGREVAP
jgi:hypothetical protein